MTKLQIDGQPVEVPPGTTVLEAARRLGLELPTLCYCEPAPASGSCLVCAVQVKATGHFIPACAAVAQEGMDLASETPEVHAARRAALELLLSEHLGECTGLCQRACPAGLDVPTLLRLVQEERLDAALAQLARTLPLAAILGRLCHHPCEAACRRGHHDEAVAIQQIERWLGDALPKGGSRPLDGDVAEGGSRPLDGDVAEGGSRPLDGDCLGGPHTSAAPAAAAGRAEPGPPSGRLAVVGSGPAGLAAAWELLLAGYPCTLLEQEAEAGGSLRAAVARGDLPAAILATELARLAAAGVELRTRAPVTRPADLRDEFCHVLAPDQTVRPKDRLVHVIAHGRTAAAALVRLLRSEAEPATPFQCSLPRLDATEMAALLVGADAAGRVTPAGDGLTAAEAVREAARCLGCDCRVAATCRLRLLAGRYGARQTHFAGQRDRFSLCRDHPQLVFEAGKCIRCGNCVSLAAAAGENPGLSLVGRGAGTRLEVPGGRPLAEGLQRAATACLAACPTGALAAKDRPHDGQGNGCSAAGCDCAARGGTV